MTRLSRAPTARSKAESDVMSGVSRNSIQTTVFFVLFASLFMMAEHISPFSQARGEEWTADFLISAREGSLQRRLAYILLAATTAALAVRVRPIPGSGIH